MKYYASIIHKPTTGVSLNRKYTKKLKRMKTDTEAQTPFTTQQVQTTIRDAKKKNLKHEAQTKSQMLLLLLLF